MLFFFFFFKQKTAYEMRISDWSSDVCSSDLGLDGGTTATVDVTADMSASDVVYAINAVSSTTGARASAVKVADGDYRIVFTAEETNKAIQITGDSGATLAALNVSADNGATFSTELKPHPPRTGEHPPELQSLQSN